MMKITFAISCLIMLSAQSILRVDEGSEQAYLADEEPLCNGELLNMILTDEMEKEFKPSDANGDITKICPNLKKTCCNKTQLQSLYDSIDKAYDSLDELNKSRSNWVKIISKISEEDEKKFIESIPKDRSKCISEDQIKAISESIKKLREANTDKLLESNTLLNKRNTHFFSGFGCSFCSLDYPKAIIREEGSATVDVKFSLENAKYISQIRIDNLKASSDLLDVINVWRGYYCTKNEETDPHIEKRAQVDASLKIIEDCMKNDFKDADEKTKECTAYLNNSRLVTGAPFANLYRDMKTIDDSMMDLQAAYTKETFVPFKVPTNIAYYHMNVKSSIKNTIVVIDKDGLSTKDTKMKSDKWEFASIVGVIGTLLFAFL